MLGLWRRLFPRNRSAARRPPSRAPRRTLPRLLSSCLLEDERLNLLMVEVHCQRGLGKGMEQAQQILHRQKGTAGPQIKDNREQWGFQRLPDVWNALAWILDQTIPEKEKAGVVALVLAAPNRLVGRPPRVRSVRRVTTSDMKVFTAVKMSTRKARGRGTP